MNLNHLLHTCVVSGALLLAGRIATASQIEWQRVSSLPQELVYLGVVKFGNGDFVGLQIGNETYPNGTIFYSEDSGATWRFGRNVPQLSYTGLALGNDRFVAVTGSGLAVSSSDGGETWRTATIANSGVSDIAFGGGVFAAVGGGGLIATSSDGLSWTRISGVTPANLGRIAHGNGRFLAAQQSGFPSPRPGLFVTSSDGVNWAQFQSPSQFYTQPGCESPGCGQLYWISGLTYINGNFVIHGRTYHRPNEFDILMYSPDNGTTWTPGERAQWSNWDFNFVNSITVVNGELQPADIAFGNGVYIEGGCGFLCPILRGPSLDQMTPIIAPNVTRLLSIAANGSTVVTVGDAQWPDRGYMLVSNNGGTNFSEVTTLPAGVTTFSKVIAVNGVFVAAGAGGAIIRSSDGLSWSRRLSNTTSDLYDIAYGGGQFVAVGANGKIVASADAGIFALRASGTEVALRGVTHAVDRFVVVGDSGIVLTSTDTINWTMTATDEGNNLNSIASGNARLIATEANSIQISTDAGLSWMRDSIDGAVADEILGRIAFFDGLFVIPSQRTKNKTFVSSLGATWSESFTPPAPPFHSTSSLLNADVSGGRLWLSGYYSGVWVGTPPEIFIMGGLDASGRFSLSIDVAEAGNYRVLTSNVIPNADWVRRDLLSVTDHVDWIDPDEVSGARFYQVVRE